MVNLTTQRSHSDTTTIIQPGEHPFVDRPTVVFYADARIVNANILEEGLRHQHAALSANLIQRIQNDLFVSRFTPNKIKEAFKIAPEKKLT